MMNLRELPAKKRIHPDKLGCQAENSIAKTGSLAALRRVNHIHGEFQPGQTYDLTRHVQHFIQTKCVVLGIKPEFRSAIVGDLSKKTED